MGAAPRDFEGGVAYWARTPVEPALSSSGLVFLSGWNKLKTPNLAPSRPLAQSRPRPALRSLELGETRPSGARVPASQEPECRRLTRPRQVRALRGHLSRRRRIARPTTAQRAASPSTEAEGRRSEALLCGGLEGAWTAREAPLPPGTGMGRCIENPFLFKLIQTLR